MADQVIVKIFGTEALMAKLQQLGNFFNSDEFRGLLEDTGMAYVNLAKAAVPISRSPGATGLVAGGTLRNSINYQVQEFGTPGVKVRVGVGGPGAGYAQYVEEGTGPSMRVPIRANYMFWMEDGAGRTVNVPWTGGLQPGWSAHYRKVVWHPGTRAQPFFFKHLEPVTERMMAAMARLINQKFSQL